MKKTVARVLLAIMLVPLSGCKLNYAVLGYVKEYEVDTSIHSLDIRINSAELIIKEADEFSVESNLKYLTVEENGGILEIIEMKKAGKIYDDAVLTVFIPANTNFKRINLEVGACAATIAPLSADVINIHHGAGDVYFDSLTANDYANIDGGAGEIVINYGILNNLDLEMGVGKIDLKASLLGECALDFGVGKSNIRLIGDKSDYSLELEKGLGDIRVDGKDFMYYESNVRGRNRIGISGGVGDINIMFIDENS